MARIKCPNCHKNQDITGRYDDMFDNKITCKYCNLTVAGFCWEYVYRPNKEEDKNED